MDTGGGWTWGGGGVQESDSWSDSSGARIGPIFSAAIIVTQATKCPSRVHVAGHGSVTGPVSGVGWASAAIIILVFMRPTWQPRRATCPGVQACTPAHMDWALRWCHCVCLPTARANNALVRTTGGVVSLVCSACTNVLSGGGGGRTLSSIPKIPSPAPNHRKKVIFMDHQKK